MQEMAYPCYNEDRCVCVCACVPILLFSVTFTGSDSIPTAMIPFQLQIHCSYTDHAAYCDDIGMALHRCHDGEGCGPGKGITAQRGNVTCGVVWCGVVWCGVVCFV